MDYIVTLDGIMGPETRPAKLLTKAKFVAKQMRDEENELREMFASPELPKSGTKIEIVRPGTTTG